MSISYLDQCCIPSAPVAIPVAVDPRIGVPMTVQNRIRFECFLMVGHAGVCLEFQCHSQAPFELERDGLKTTEVFVDRVDRFLQSAPMEAEYGGPIPGRVRAAVRSSIFSLDNGVSQDINFRHGPVSLCGRTTAGCPWCASA